MSLQDRSRRKGMEVIENGSDEQQEFISGTSSSQSKGGRIDRVCSVCHIEPSHWSKALKMLDSDWAV